MPRTYIWPVRGMHCASCERIVAEALRTLPGVLEVEVSLKKQKAGIRVSQDAPKPDLAAVNRELAKTGHFVGIPQTAAPDVCVLPGQPLPLKRRFLEAFGAVLLVGLAIAIFLRPLSQFIPNFTANQSIAALFALGLVASVSTCLAAHGAFFLAYTSVGRSRRQIVFLHVGRLVAFALGGAVLGGIGAAFQVAGWMYGLIALVLGFGFVMVGLHLLDLAPSLASVGIRLPSRFSRVADRVRSSNSPTTPFLVGAVTFVLPCGFTQTAQALALASGSVVQGTLMMFAFGLGTLPVLYAVTVFGSTATLRSRLLRLLAGSSLFLFAFGQIDGGLTVLGSPVTIGGLASQATAVFRSTAVPTANAQEQLVSMTVAYGAFSPNRFTIKRGVPVRWEVNGVDVSGCASTLIAPKLGIARNLTPGLNVIQFTPNQRGVIPFSCGMGMIRGSFNVVD